MLVAFLTNESVVLVHEKLVRTLYFNIQRILFIFYSNMLPVDFDELAEKSCQFI